MTPEPFDAVVVGARCAGSAAAITLARAGRRVVALDRARFPADTLSTHLLFPSGVWELRELGALKRVRALGPPPLRTAMVAGAGFAPSAPFTPLDGVDHGLCVRRTGLDAALVETARAAGAEVREGVTVTSLLWEGARVAGVVLDDGTELRAPLVVGADGRRSTVARAVGADDPYRSSPNGRACYFAYYREEQAGAWGTIAAQWREGAELATAFPCDGGLVLVLLMPPVARIDDFRGSLADEFDRTVAAIPGLAARLRGCARETKVRSALDTTSYFRRSSGPGWALPGDAGHFKDPVTAQGIRDALRYGRLLGEAAAPVLDDPAALDSALLLWERRRERECLEVYQWTNRLGRGEPMSPLEVELYRQMSREPAATQRLLEVFSRMRRPVTAVPPLTMARLAARAVRRGDRRVVTAAVRREVHDAVGEWRTRRRATAEPLPLVTGPRPSAVAGSSRHGPRPPHPAGRADEPRAAAGRRA